MLLLGTHGSLFQRLRLADNRDLGAGNFFWHAWRVATDKDRPLLFHPQVTQDGWGRRQPPGLSLDDVRLAAIRYANFYRGMGIRPGDRVGLYTRYRLAGLLQHIAITAVGAVAVHCNPRMAPVTATDHLRRTDIAVLVADRELLAECVEA